MSQDTTPSPDAGQKNEAEQSGQNAKPTSATRRAKAGPKKTSSKPKESKPNDSSAPATATDPTASGDISVEDAIKATGAVVRPPVEPNAKAPKPIPATPDDVYQMRVDGKRVSIVTVDGKKFSGKIA